MKTRLFRTVVAFLFAGLALTQVGCDYGKQIDDLNNRIDELTTGKIASIESQYNSLQTTLAALQAKDATMETKSAELQAAINTLQSSLSGFLTKDQLNATLTSYATSLLRRQSALLSLLQVRLWRIRSRLHLML